MGAGWSEANAFKEASTGAWRLGHVLEPAGPIGVGWGRGWGTRKTFTAEGTFGEILESWGDLVLEAEGTP